MKKDMKKIHIYEVISEEHPFRLGSWFVRKGTSMTAIVDKDKWWGAKMVGYSNHFKDWLNKGLVKEIKSS